jgi:hypothetical protein
MTIEHSRQHRDGLLVVQVVASGHHRDFVTVREPAGQTDGALVVIDGVDQLEAVGREGRVAPLGRVENTVHGSVARWQ